jgi:uncharacterized Zn-binding protein involved in type VI secretion
MMPPVSRLGDIGGIHGCWPIHNSSAASPNVIVNGIPVHRQGDAWNPHTCPSIPETHASVLAAGSSTVFVNGKGISRIGDPIACGGTIAAGSGDVFAGG